MRRLQTISKSVLLSCVFLISACGGGGGGDGEDASSNGNARTGVRVLHGAIEAAPIRVTRSTTEGQVEVGTVRFAETALYLELPEGDLSLRAALRSGSERTVSSEVLTVENRSRFSLLIAGRPGTDVSSARLIQDVTPELEGGQTALRVAHAVGRAGSVMLSVTNGTPGGSTAAEAIFGAASAYAPLEAGILRYTITRTIDGSVIASGTFTAEEGRSYTIFAGGEFGAYTFASVLED